MATTQELRATWARANGEDPNDPELDDLLPDAKLAPLLPLDDDVLAGAATLAMRADDRRLLRPTTWIDKALALQSKAARYGRCGHGSLPGLCATCPDPSIRSEPTRGDDVPLKRDSVKRLCTLLGLNDTGIGVGSSIPSNLFREMARRCGVPYESMPQVAEDVAAKAQVPWDYKCDSRDTQSEGGSTVTGEGLRRLTVALERLL